MANNPLLSICIPTFNRAGYLESTLRSIVSQCRFQETNDVEIVISDNCSDDDTQNIALAFVKAYGEKVRYFRNDKNIADANFERVLSYGKGTFLKLNNDNLKHRENSLNIIIQAIIENKENKNVLFFSNGVLSLKENIICDSLDSFVDIVSFYSTWIGAFGLWKESFKTLNDFNRYSYLQLPQVDVLCRLINSHAKVFVNDDRIFISVTTPNKGGYDFIKVFMDNYLFILNECVNNKSLNEKTYVSEKRKLLLRFLRTRFAIIKIYPEKYTFKFDKMFRRVFWCYKNDIWTYTIFVGYYFLTLAYYSGKKNIEYTNRG